MGAAKYDLEIVQGETFIRTIRWETKPYVYKAISAISRAAPAVLTVPLHGAPAGWRVAVVSGNMTEIIAAHTPPWPSDFNQATVLSVNSIELNDVNSTDFTAYTSGASLLYLTPKDLSGYTARMTVKTRVGGDVLAAYTSADGDIVLDNTAKTITLTLPATDTAAYEWTRGVYDLELVSGASPAVVTPLLKGSVKIAREVTT